MEFQQGASEPRVERRGNNEKKTSKYTSGHQDLGEFKFERSVGGIIRPRARET